MIKNINIDYEHLPVVDWNKVTGGMIYPEHWNDEPTGWATLTINYLNGRQWIFENLTYTEAEQLKRSLEAKWKESLGV